MMDQTHQQEVDNSQTGNGVPVIHNTRLPAGEIAGTRLVEVYLSGHEGESMDKHDGRGGNMVCNDTHPRDGNWTGCGDPASLSGHGFSTIRCETLGDALDDSLTEDIREEGTGHGIVVPQPRTLMQNRKGETHSGTTAPSKPEINLTEDRQEKEIGSNSVTHSRPKRRKNTNTKNRSAIVNNDEVSANPQPAQRKKKNKIPRKQYPKPQPHTCPECHQGFTDFHVHSKDGTSEGMKHRCPVCYRLLETLTRLKHHIASEHMIHRLHKCGKCGRSYSTKYGLYKHTQQGCHACMGGRFRCGQCNKTFKTKESCDLHGRYHEGLNPKQCALCGKVFTRYCYLREHIANHNPQNRFTSLCEICGASLGSKRHLMVHMRHCHQLSATYIPCVIKRHSCSVCSKEFRDKHGLKVHMVIHTPGPKAFVCHVCGSGYSANKSLNNHLVKTHNLGDPESVSKPCSRLMPRHRPKKHQCEVCGLKCEGASNLRRHVLRHTGEKPFACTICEKRYQTRSDLDRHVGRHATERAYACDMCEKKYPNRSELNRHTKSKHGSQ